MSLLLRTLFTTVNKSKRTGREVEELVCKYIETAQIVEETIQSALSQGKV
ncbi:hypothetical protein NEPAR06_0845 [Nematocida parisii]|uniref:Uncharacterized protein n=1 Tax=Nematocida parisii (strain ERTm3) TaxID=935791 RepID=I3EEN8_NEMP3|nr:uncharacterized protein NEPG_02314 [Nematocida parisii ERTm1]EIJ87685.1 hypothetical protein NEQG_02232 [Nematocida parisii ERTm3]KAI5127708.1 hypothetical protein NEPAR03_1047 [Nematocida parisii]KAI5167281.1 hypothetical protein NEIRO02_1826 [Nematocida sp. AWRm79]KAI5184675.1 hypothetical protein NEIRO03_1803 [Nematocida sp. AWRm78]OAG32995.1 hypothetical protein NEIG_01568 [Nematocida sp. ERTm5]|eukprot:XP_013060141.1 hypothetical protein NEPG_02314 [Nematocida parisii ERTm1]